MLSDFLEIYSTKNIILAGDFNMIFGPKEKSGGNYGRDQMFSFVEELSHQWDLLNFKPEKGIYTWTNNWVGTDHISTHLDRFLVQGSLLLEKMLISSKILPKLTSNHKPILLLLEEEENLGPLLFRYNPLWTERDEFMKVVQTTWSTHITGSPSYVWEHKIKLTKLALKSWIKKHNNTPSSHRKEIVQLLADLQSEKENKEITTS